MRMRFGFLRVVLLFLLAGNTCISCKKESSVVVASATLESYAGSLKIQLKHESIEKIFTAQFPWEAKGLNYFNVIQQDSVWSMWYNSFASNQGAYNGSFCLATSGDGKNWTRPSIKDNTNILINGGNYKSITESYVFKDRNDTLYPYKMICTKLINDEEKTFLYASRDGIKWQERNKLYNQKQDSQFGVIESNGLFYIFSRYNDYSNGYQRAIGLSTLDKNLNEVEAPKLLLEADPNSAFPHIYNNAASKINDSTFLLFPTFFNESNGNVRVKLIYTNNLLNYYTVNDNLNSDLFPNDNVNWIIVSPGVMPAGEPNTYWLYYMTTPVKHGLFRSATNLYVSYYRIKLVISE